MATREQIEAAAAAIANARSARHGAPQVANVLELLRRLPGGKLYNELLDDARAALEAAESTKPSA